MESSKMVKNSARHQAFKILADALREFLDSGEYARKPINPYTGNFVYNSLCAVHTHVSKMKEE